MLAIKNNIMAANAARYLGSSYDALARSVERLASGLRINSARDDAAGLAVRELMRADIAMLQQGARNTLDGISLLQTMEGAMEAIDNALVRMKQLAEQASTGVYSSAQRVVMNGEFEEMAAEIDRIAQATVFNSITMLDSASTDVTIHFGQRVSTAAAGGLSAANDTITVTAQNMRIGSGLEIDNNTIDITSTTSAQTALTAVTSAIIAKDQARAAFGYSMNRLDSTAQVLGIQTENLRTAESRISDVDVATEMSELTKNQVLSQAGVAMLAQANAMPQMALTLLR
ncbi:MAG: flagellin N-terminal helical domain-containing protein [Planctomycetota bacterium]|jgi:flagellin